MPYGQQPPLDPMAFVGAILLFAVTGMAACAMPVRRALQGSPLEALRED